MGLLKPISNGEKAYGLIGFDKTIESTGERLPAYIGRERGHVAEDVEMTDAGAQNKYLIVSVWPNSYFTKN